MVRPVPGRGGCRRRPEACGSAAGRNLFPSGRGCRESPAALRPPFFFFLRKRMRRARWKKKTLWAAAFQTSFEMPFPALFTGVWTDGSRRLCLLCLPLTRTNVRVPPGCTAVLCSLPHPGGCRDFTPTHFRPSATTRLRQQNRSRGIRDHPQLSKLPYVVEWTQALESAPK